MMSLLLYNLVFFMVQFHLLSTIADIVNDNMRSEYRNDNTNEYITVLSDKQMKEWYSKQDFDCKSEKKNQCPMLLIACKPPYTTRNAWRKVPYGYENIQLNSSSNSQYMESI